MMEARAYASHVVLPRYNFEISFRKNEAEILEFSLNVNILMGIQSYYNVSFHSGNIWILGGQGKNGDILSSTEILENTDFGVWTTKKGPKMPLGLFSHCTTLLPGGKVSESKKLFNSRPMGVLKSMAYSNFSVFSGFTYWGLRW